MKRARLSGGVVGLVAVLVVLLVMAVWGFRAAWRLGGNTPLGLHGWIAMALAAVFVLALGGGLMALAFYSSRHGYDDDSRDEGLHSLPDAAAPEDRRPLVERDPKKPLAR